MCERADAFVASLRATGGRQDLHDAKRRGTIRRRVSATSAIFLLLGRLPAQKAARVRQLQRAGRIGAMAGNGIDDASALVQADVGIAMVTATDVAMQSAGMTLVKGDLQGIVRARRLSRLAMRNIRQNLFFAFLHNSRGVPIAAGALYPALGLLLSPMLAAAMSLSSVSVIAKALRLDRASV